MLSFGPEDWIKARRLNRFIVSAFATGQERAMFRLIDSVVVEDSCGQRCDIRVYGHGSYQTLA